MNDIVNECNSKLAAFELLKEQKETCFKKKQRESSEKLRKANYEITRLLNEIKQQKVLLQIKEGILSFECRKF